MTTRTGTRAGGTLVATVIATVLGVALVAAGCSRATESSGTEPAGGAQREPAAEQPVSEAPDEPTASPAASEPARTASGKVPYAIIETNRGRIVIKLFPEKAPRTVENFIKLANEKFYDGIRWHRVEPGFVIQGGDPLSRDNDPSNDGLGGPGYTIPDEFNDLPHLEGTVAMAHSAFPNSGGSQFYICLAPQPSLDGKYTVFGQTVEGLDVVHAIRVGDVMKTVRVEYRDR